MDTKIFSRYNAKPITLTVKNSVSPEGYEEKSGIITGMSQDDNNKIYEFRFLEKSKFSTIKVKDVLCFQLDEAAE